MEEGETKETGNQDVGGCSSRVKLQLENQSDDSDDEEEDFESMAFPAISPVSNISTSSGKYTINRKLNYHNPITNDCLIKKHNRLHFMWVIVIIKTNNTCSVE